MGREARARVVREIAGGITKLAANNGLLVQTGWEALVATYYKEMPKEQLPLLREVFFLGAHHVLASLMNVADPGSDATDADMKRMSLLDHELEAFLQAFKQAHGVTDDILPSESGPRN